MADPKHGQEQSVDLVQSSRWRPLRLLLNAMDDDIAKVYREAEIGEVRPRFTGPLIQLGRAGPMTIRELADAFGLTHSAMSQTVSAMRAAGFVESAPGDDARTRRVRLSVASEALVRFLEAEWRATESAIAELEEEIPYPLSKVVRDIEQALANRSFRARIETHLAEGPMP